MQLGDVLSTIWKRRLPAALVFIVCVAAASAYAFSQPKRYESTATIAFTPNTKQDQFLPSESLSTLLATYAAVAKSTQNREAARALLGHAVTGTLSTSTGSGSGILEIIDVDTNPQRAAETARAIAQAFINSIANNGLLVPTIVNPPVASDTPVQPRPKLIVSVAAVLGLIAAVMLALALEHFRPTAETSTELTELTQLPVVGWFKRERALVGGESLVWGSDKLFEAQETYRSLRTNLEIMLEARPAVIQVTSADAGQGKSTIVANLAIALGQLDIPTTIVDADLRKPRQHEIFHLPNDVGLSTAMMLRHGEVTPQPTEYDNVSVLTAGPTVANAPEMLHVRFRAIINALREQEGVVLVDSAPVLPVSDSRLIARHADAVLFVIAAGRTRASAITNALEKLRFAHANVIGLAVNFAGRDREAAGNYGYGRYGSYEESPAAGPVPTP